jgi:probable F420-dependent oxidoreductase
VRFTYAEAMIDPAFWVPLAQAAEDAGYHSISVADSVAYPKESDSTYPYTADGSREFLEDKPFLDPFVLMTAMGAATSRIRFTTFVIKLPIRSPVLVAKQAASVAVVTNNRLGLGVGTSPWPEDYELTGTPWARRGKRMDEAIDIIRGLTAPDGGWFEYRGEIFDLPAVKITPVPTEPIPILIGGHHEAALRRAARVGDGWMHGGGDPADLPGLLQRLAELRAEEGTAERPFEIHVISADAYTPDGVRRLEDMGVTDAIVGFRWPYVPGPDTEPLQTKLDALRRFADTVISKL